MREAVAAAKLAAGEEVDDCDIARLQSAAVHAHVALGARLVPKWDGPVVTGPGLERLGARMAATHANLARAGVRCCAVSCMWEPFGERPTLDEARFEHAFRAEVDCAVGSFGSVAREW